MAALRTWSCRDAPHCNDRTRSASGQAVWGMGGGGGWCRPNGRPRRPSSPSLSRSSTPSLLLFSMSPTPPRTSSPHKGIGPHGPPNPRPSRHGADRPFRPPVQERGAGPRADASAAGAVSGPARASLAIQKHAARRLSFDSSAASHPGQAAWHPATGRETRLPPSASGMTGAVRALKESQPCRRAVSSRAGQERSSPASAGCRSHRGPNRRPRRQRCRR